MRCPLLAEPLPGRLSPQAQFRLVSTAAQARREKLHRTRACSRLTGGAVRQNGNVSHQPWAAKPVGVACQSGHSSRAAGRHPRHHTTQRTANTPAMRGEQPYCCARNVEAICGTVPSKSIDLVRAQAKLAQRKTAGVTGCAARCSSVRGAETPRKRIHAAHDTHTSGTQCRFRGRVAPKLLLVFSPFSELQYQIRSMKLRRFSWLIAVVVNPQVSIGLCRQVI